MSVLAALPPITAAELLGTWHVVRTNFPMWTRGDKLAPTFEYSATDQRDRLGDAVRYRTRAGGPGEILGVDTQDPTNPAHFTWRGRGWLWPITSDWWVLRRRGDLAAIYFTKTLFTPVGLDVIARSPEPDEAAVEALLAEVAGLPGMAAQVATLVTPAR